MQRAVLVSFCNAYEELFAVDDALSTANRARLDAIGRFADDYRVLIEMITGLPLDDDDCTFRDDGAHSDEDVHQLMHLYALSRVTYVRVYAFLL